MQMKKNNWLQKRRLRSVEALRLWSNNPRLNPDGDYLRLTDYLTELLSDKSERDSFLKLVKAISENGFIPYDPIVVWKNKTDNTFCVAEGNRRVLALKLLLKPERAPKPIRSKVASWASAIDKEAIKKIFVIVAPSLDEVKWYINERHNSSSLQKSWSRLQQQRWVYDLYKMYNGDIDRIVADTSMDKTLVESDIRILKLLDLLKLPEVRNTLSPDIYEQAISHRFPITILERFFNYSDVRNSWNISFDGIDVKINSDRQSFCDAYSELIRRIITGDGDVKINTRMTAEQAPEILKSLPSVIASDADMMTDLAVPCTSNKVSETKEKSSRATKKEEPVIVKGNIDRPKLVLPIYELNSVDARLNTLFNELKKIPLASYPTCVSVSMRVFLDITVRLFIERKNWTGEVCTKFKCGFKDTTLKQRLSFFKDKLGTADFGEMDMQKKNELKKIVARLLNPKNEFSLDVLNGYVHSSTTHYSLKQFLNAFWDSIFPLLQSILGINEIQDVNSIVNQKM